jgi:hypothetical protein
LWWEKQKLLQLPDCRQGEAKEADATETRIACTDSSSAKT